MHLDRSIVENKRIHLGKPTSQEEMEKEGFEAEKELVNLLKFIPGLKVRPATAEEDSGKEIALGQKGLAIDAIGYILETPAAGFQITITNNLHARQEKIEDLTNRPFMRLPGMKIQETPIPRVLVFVDHREMTEYLKDRDILKHPKIEKQIRESALASLGFTLTKTINLKERDTIRKLMDLFGFKK